MRAFNACRAGRLLRSHDASPALPEIAIQRLNAKSTTQDTSPQAKYRPASLAGEDRGKERHQDALWANSSKHWLRGVLAATKSHPQWKTLVKEGQGRRGIACGFWFNIGGESTAQVHINEDGSVTEATGSPDTADPARVSA
jgi:hypothetical protein